MRRARSMVCCTFLLVVCAAFAAPAQEGTLPPVPHALVSQLGPIPIHFVPGLECGGKAVFGCFDVVNRTIFLRDSMPLEVQWHTLFHEQFHQVLFDGGQSLKLSNGERDQLEDRIADVVATARVNELLTLVRQLAQMAKDRAEASVEQAGAARPATGRAPRALAPPPPPVPPQ